MVKVSNKKLEISYYGYGTPLGGYGIANWRWLTHLKRLGVEVYFDGTWIPKKGTFEWSILNDEEKEIAETPFKLCRIGIIETTPFDFNRIKTKLKIANTMSESSEVSGSWLKNLNSMDMIVVPNQWNKESFERSGVNVPIRIIPHGTWTEMFPYYERKKQDIFTFGIVGYLNERKGVFDVIKAFSSEFSPEEPVRLYLKSSNKDFGYYSNFSDPRITCDIKHLTPQELRDLYYSFDCFVFPSKAEGIGQPPREAMSTGLPVILTRYSGLEEIADLTYAFPLEPTKLIRGANPQNVEQIGNWAEIDIQELMYQMRYVYEHQDLARLKGKIASRKINQYHSWPVCAQKMIDLLQELT